MQNYKKKINKLFRNPKQFFVDSKIFKHISKKSQKPIKLITAANPALNKTPLEPRIFAVFDVKNGLVKVEFENRKVDNIPQSSVIFLEDLGEKILKYKLFLSVIGLKTATTKEKTLFFSLYNPEIDNINLFSSYDEQVELKKFIIASPMIEIRNLFFINPKSSFPFFVKSFHRNSRLIVFIDNTVSFDIIAEYYKEVDALIITQELSSKITSPFRRVVVINTDTMDENIIANSINQVSIQHNTRNIDILLPVFGDIEFTQNIGEANYLLKNHLLDGVFYVKPFNLKSCAAETYNDVNEVIAQNIKAILLSENATFRYKTLIAKKDVKNLVSYIMSDGLRIKFIYE